MSRRPKALVRFSGGLGNQLFQLSHLLGLHRASRSVAVDTSWYRRHGRDLGRSLDISPLLRDFPTARSLDPMLVTAALRRRARRRGAGDFVDRVWGVEVHSGYWQDASAVELVQSEMVSLLRRVPAVAAMASGTPPYVAVHVRLGDYLAPDTRAFHGLTDVQGQLAVADTLRRRIDAEWIRVFTDSPDDIVDISSGFPRVDVAAAGDAWQALTGMAEGSALVMSNSSLSWWAATIACWKGLDPSLVFMPTPWLADSSNLDVALIRRGWSRYERVLS